MTGAELALLAPVASYCVLAFSHLTLWKLRPPRNQYNTLLLLALAVWGGFALAWPRSVSWAEILSAHVFYWAAALSHIIVYSAVQADSPSMTILLRVDRAGVEGLEPSLLSDELNDSIMISPRIDDLLTGRLAIEREGRLKITARGACLARVHACYRAVLGMEKGG